MKSSKVIFLTIFLICLSAGIVSGASSIPVVSEITGPDPSSVNLNDASITYTYTATVTGGQAPYTYRWEARGNVIAEGASASVTLDSVQMAQASNGAGYWVYLKVTDANGKMANYVEDGELETLFIYGISNGAVVKHPSEFPYTMRVDGEDVEPETGTVIETPTETVEDDSGVRFSGLNGQVEVLFPGETEWDFADLTTALPEGTRIKTDVDSSCVLSFTDMSTFILKSESEVIISTKSEKDTKLDLLAGNIWVNVKKMVNDGSLSVEMNQAIAGAKGTTFVCLEQGGLSILYVIEGTVEFTNTESDEVETVTGGENVYVKDGETSEVKSFDVEMQKGYWTTLQQQYNIQQVSGLEIIESSATDTGTTSGDETETDSESDSSMIPGFTFYSIAVGVAVLVPILRKKSV